MWLRQLCRLTRKLRLASSLPCWTKERITRSLCPQFPWVPRATVARLLPVLCQDRARCLSDCHMVGELPPRWVSMPPTILCSWTSSRVIATRTSLTLSPRSVSQLLLTIGFQILMSLLLKQVASLTSENLLGKISKECRMWKSRCPAKSPKTGLNPISRVATENRF